MGYPLQYRLLLLFIIPQNDFLRLFSLHFCFYPLPTMCVLFCVLKIFCNVFICLVFHYNITSVVWRTAVLRVLTIMSNSFSFLILYNLIWYGLAHQYQKHREIINRIEAKQKRNIQNSQQQHTHRKNCSVINALFVTVWMYILCFGCFYIFPTLKFCNSLILTERKFCWHIFWNTITHNTRKAKTQRWSFMFHFFYHKNWKFDYSIIVINVAKKMEISKTTKMQRNW